MANLIGRMTNTTGRDDPLLWAILKDYTRPYRQGLVGMGGAGTNIGRRLAGQEGIGSDYLERGMQGVGDWDFLLDDEEIAALRKAPGKEAAKSVGNVGLQALEAMIGPQIWGRTAGMKVLPRIGARGLGMLPTNLGQAVVMNEPEKGEDIGGALLGSTIGSFAGPALGEGVQAGMRGLEKVGDKLFGGGRYLERLSKGVRTDESPWGRATSEEKFKATEDVIRKYAPKEGVLRKGYGIGAGQASDVGNQINTKLDTLIKSKAGETVDISKVVKDTVDELVSLYGYSEPQAQTAAQAALNKAVQASGGEVVDGKVSVPVLAGVKRYLQPLAREFTEGSQKKGLEIFSTLHEGTYDTLRGSLGKAGDALYSDLHTLWQTVPNMLKNVDEGLMGTQYFQGVKIPFLPGIIGMGGSLLGRGMEGLGNVGRFAGDIGQQAIEKVPAGLSGMLGGAMGRQIGAQPVPPQEEVPMQQGLGVPEHGGGLIQEALGGGQPGQMGQPGQSAMIQAALAEQGFGGQEEPTGSQVDMENLIMQLMQGISSGSISGADAQAMLGLAQMLGQRQPQYSEDYEPENMLDAIDYLGQRYPDMTPATRASLAKNLMGETPKLNEEAVSGLRILNQLGPLVSGLGLKGGWLGAQFGAPGLSIGASTGANPEAALYKDIKDAFLTTLSRASGERGVLTDKDIERLDNALPDFNDTEDLARRKMQEVKDLLYNRLGISESDAAELLGLEEKDPYSEGIVGDYDSWNQ
jgi:hypothetical protein